MMDNGETTGTQVRPLVLVAEDVGVQVRLMQLCLERADYRVIAAKNGADALAQISAHCPNLIILDVDMPELNGFQVLDTLRRTDETRAIPVIMLTAHAKDSVLFDEWATERDVFMTKPFSPPELIARVRRILDPTVVT
jgi:two-component system, OmpR family, phosphate regulon response regulator PhoB